MDDCTKDAVLSSQLAMVRVAARLSEGDVRGALRILRESDIGETEDPAAILPLFQASNNILAMSLTTKDFKAGQKACEKCESFDSILSPRCDCSLDQQCGSGLALERASTQHMQYVRIHVALMRNKALLLGGMKDAKRALCELDRCYGFEREHKLFCSAVETLVTKAALNIAMKRHLDALGAMHEAMELLRFIETSQDDLGVEDDELKAAKNLVDSNTLRLKRLYEKLGWSSARVNRFLYPNERPRRQEVTGRTKHYKRFRALNALNSSNLEPTDERIDPGSYRNANRRVPLHLEDIGPKREYSNPQAAIRRKPVPPKRATQECHTPLWANMSFPKPENQRLLHNYSHIRYKDNIIRKEAQSLPGPQLQGSVLQAHEIIAQSKGDNEPENNLTPHPPEQGNPHFHMRATPPPCAKVHVRKVKNDELITEGNIDILFGQGSQKQSETESGECEMEDNPHIMDEHEFSSRRKSRDAQQEDSEFNSFESVEKSNGDFNFEDTWSDAD